MPTVSRVKDRSTPKSTVVSGSPGPNTECGRTALRRILWIHERLGNQQSVTAVSLARELETSTRTVKRDIEFMRDQLGAPIEWDGALHTYGYTKTCDILPMLRLDAGEAMALALASQTFAAWHGTPLGRALTAALEKIASVIGGAVSLPASEVTDFVSHPADPGADMEHRWFATLFECIRRRRVVMIQYQKPRTNAAPETRLLHPLHLAFLDHHWTLIAHDPTRKSRRNFLLSRIRDAKASPGGFVPPDGFNLHAYLRGSLGRFAGGDRETEVRIAFDARLAPYLRERPWHASQTIQERPDGSIEVTFRLNQLTDLHRRLLACGGHFEVLSPASLRETIRAEGMAIARRHSDSTSQSLEGGNVSAPVNA